MQTIIASKVFKPPQITTVKERIERDDGDFIDINLSIRTDLPIVAIFHGLAGCVESSYVQGAFRSLESNGFRPILMHWRGCSGEPNRLAGSYHSGASDEIDWFIRYLAKRFPGTAVYALGYSLGANALLKYLGESSAKTPVSGAVAVSPPLVLDIGAAKLNRGLAKVYQRYLLSLMRHQHEAKRSRYPDLTIPVAGPELDTFWKFDDAITAPVHGYKSAADYYKRCSARQFLPAIEVPTRIICAQDDPFFTPDILPSDSELSSGTTLELSRFGGHVGFLDTDANNRRWLDGHIASILAGFRTQRTPV